MILNSAYIRRCPECNSKNLRLHKRTAFCHSCKHSGPLLSFARSQKSTTTRAPAARGSGQVAERITVPAYRWDEQSDPQPTEE